MTGERFENWEMPEFDEKNLTKWNWMCQYHDKLILGKNTDIGAFTYINAHFGVVIEEDVEIGAHCIIYSHNTIDGTSGRVVIKKGAKIGAQSTIFPGVTIGEGALIGAYSLVKSDIPANVLAYGIPAKVIKNLKDSE